MNKDQLIIHMRASLMFHAHGSEAYIESAKAVSTVTDLYDTIARQAAVIARVEALADGYDAFMDSQFKAGKGYEPTTDAYETVLEELRAALTGESQ